MANIPNSKGFTVLSCKLLVSLTINAGKATGIKLKRTIPKVIRKTVLDRRFDFRFTSEFSINYYFHI